MTKYALIEISSGDVLGLYDATSVPAAPQGQEFRTLLPGQAVPSGSSAGRKLREANGALYWHDTRTLAEAQALRIAAMREARDAVLNGTFTWDGSTFDADQVSQTRLLGAVVAALEPGFDPTLWRLADNTWRELTATQLRAVYQALQQHVRACFTQFGQREAAINAATTVAAVDAVTWE